jgi:hypothetical protein
MIGILARVLAGHFAARPWDEMAVNRVEARRLARHGFIDANEPNQDDCVEAVKGLLAVLREPSEAMLAQVVPAPEHLIAERADPVYERDMRAAVNAERLTVAARWRELIDAALGEAR